MGVGSIAFIDLRVDGNDGWDVRTVTINSDLQSTTVICDVIVDSSSTERCGKPDMCLPHAMQTYEGQSKSLDNNISLRLLNSIWRLTAL